MLMSGLESEKLFSKVVPVFESRTRKTYLLLTMDWNEASSYKGRVLEMTLTDDDDIHFLYYMNMDQEEYQTYKVEHGIRREFLDFPQFVIEYLQNSLLEDHNPEPKFSLNFTPRDKDGYRRLEIIETSKFKLTNHLHFRFTAATEIDLKKHQSSLFKYLKETNKRLQNNLDYTDKDLKGKLAACQQALSYKVDEIELVKKELKIELSSKENNHQKELQEVRERLISRHKDEIHRLEKEFKTKEHNFRKDIQQFESRVNVLDSLNRELEDKNYKHESTIRELKSKVLSLEDEIKRLKENVQSYEHKYNHLSSDFKLKQSSIMALEENICDLQQKLSCKEQSLSKLKNRLEAEIEAKKLFENKYEDVKFHFEMIENQRKVLQADKEKSNDVIIGLQDKIKDFRNEVKTLSHTVAKHKKTIDEKEVAILDLKQEIAELNIVLQTKNAEVKKEIDSKHNLHLTIKKLKADLHSSENMNSYLKKQMLEAGVFPVYASPPHLISPTAIAEKELDKINSQRHKNSPPVLTGKSGASKSVRIEEAASPICKQRNSFPPHSHRTGTDSAYHTASLHTNQNSPEILAGNHKMNYNPSDFEVDPEVLNGAFGDGEHNLKHSTAKKTAKPSKSSKPVNSSTPKSSKKRR